MRDLERSEGQYVSKLSAIINYFLLPIRKRGKFLSKKEESAIFSNIEAICTVHLSFHKSLKELLAAWPVNVDIGSLFSLLVFVTSRIFTVSFQAPELVLYQEYLENFKNSLNSLQKKQTEDPKFDQFLRQITEKDTNGQELMSLLSAPLNHINQYRFHLKLLLEDTPLENSEYSGLKSSYKAMKKASEYIDASLVASSAKAKSLKALQNLNFVGFSLEIQEELKKASLVDEKFAMFCDKKKRPKRATVSGSPVAIHFPLNNSPPLSTSGSFLSTLKNKISGTEEFKAKILLFKEYLVVAEDSKDNARVRYVLTLKEVEAKEDMPESNLQNSY
jgi:hypothetical protein